MNGSFGWKGDIRWEYYFFPTFAENLTMPDCGAVSVPRAALGADEVIE
jgi:hypothetical protein